MSFWRETAVVVKGCFASHFKCPLFVAKFIFSHINVAVVAHLRILHLDIFITLAVHLNIIVVELPVSHLRIFAKFSIPYLDIHIAAQLQSPHFNVFGTGTILHLNIFVGFSPGNLNVFVEKEPLTATAIPNRMAPKSIV